MGRKLSEAAKTARLALRERQRHLEELMTAWWCADADRREAIDRMELARHVAQERVDVCVAESERLCRELVAAGMPAADVARMTEQTERSVNELLKRASRLNPTAANGDRDTVATRDATDR